MHEPYPSIYCSLHARHPRRGRRHCIAWRRSCQRTKVGSSLIEEPQIIVHQQWCWHSSESCCPYCSPSIRSWGPAWEGQWEYMPTPHQWEWGTGTGRQEEALQWQVIEKWKRERLCDVCCHYIFLAHKHASCLWEYSSAKWTSTQRIVATSFVPKCYLESVLSHLLAQDTNEGKIS